MVDEGEHGGLMRRKRGVSWRPADVVDEDVERPGRLMKRSQRISLQERTDRLGLPPAMLVRRKRHSQQLLQARHRLLTPRHRAHQR